MNMKSRFKPTKVQAREFAAKMEAVSNFCAEHSISHSLSMDSFYFMIDDQAYRISNHSIEASNRGAFDELGNQTRELYHEARKDDIIYIHASKTRLIEIYNDLISGHVLDGRGNRKETHHDR